jgi:hypothetical protein
MSRDCPPQAVYEPVEPLPSDGVLEIRLAWCGPAEISERGVDFGKHRLGIGVMRPAQKAVGIVGDQAERHQDRGGGNPSDQARISTMYRTRLGAMYLPTAPTVLLGATFCYAAWFTSIVFCVANGVRPLLIAAATIFPVGWSMALVSGSMAGDRAQW